MLARRNRPGLWALGPFADWAQDPSQMMDVWTGEPRPSLHGYNVDVREDEDHIYVEAEMPGLKKEDVEITLENGALTLKGEKKFEKEEKKDNYYLSERQYGQFSRSFQLPTIVDESKVDATLKDGILTVKLDKREEVKPRRIEVKVK